jgi:tetratricopeptide (TPR) repeat protein
MAQAQLADAYLAAGQGTEARVITEDLVAREPWVRANIERFRRALIMLGTADPDAVIAERLSGESPFLSTIDFGPLSDTLPESASGDAPPAFEDAAESPEPPAPPAVETTATDLPDFSADLPELPDLPPQPESPRPAPLGEVDLSDALSGMNKPQALEEVFDGMRSKAMRDSQVQDARAQYAAAIEHANSGRLDEAVAAFDAASRVPMMRWQAGTRLGRLHIARGDLQQGVDWLERAAQAPPPTEEDGHAVMYELADALERLGESARALAVLMELHSDAGAYRDLEARIDRLSKVQTR